MRRVIRGAAVVVVILALLALILPSLVNANRFRSRIEAMATSALGRQVTLGDLSFSLFPASLKAQDLAIADDPRFAAQPFFHAPSLELDLDLRQFLATRRFIITDLKIHQAQIALIQNSAGDWNFSSALAKPGPVRPGIASLGAESTPLDFLIKVIYIDNGRISVTQAGGTQKPTVLGNVAISVKEFSPGGGFPFSLSGKLDPAGDVKVDGAVGQINAADASLTPVQLNVKVTGVDLAAAGLTSLQGVSGVVSIDGSGSIEGTAFDGKGTIHIDRARFVRQGTPAKQPVLFDFTVRHNLHSKSGVLSQGSIHLGNAPVSVTGSYAQSGDIMKVNLRVAGSAIPVNALTGMLPALGVQLPSGSALEGGTASVNVAVTGSVADPALAGTVSLDNTTLKGFDLGRKLAAIERLAGIHPSPDTAIQLLSANVRSGPGGTTIQDLKFIAPAIGELDGAGTISLKRDLDFKMRAGLHKEGAFQLAIGSSVPFFVRGTVTSPEIVPNVAGIAASEVHRPRQVVNGIGGLFGHGKKKP